VADPETLVPVPSDGKTSGEILLRGNTVMMGYLKNPSATRKAFEGGWFHTGDVAVVHNDGYAQITDRSKDVIISGGENISSIEIEDVLHTHPAVLHAAVVGQPDAKWGEVPCAFVELKASVESKPSAEGGFHGNSENRHWKDAEVSTSRTSQIPRGDHRLGYRRVSVLRLKAPGKKPESVERIRNVQTRNLQ
jgi:acyl-CoA synthetase (AMP-forming)/AMP-acid ligase II